MGCRGDFRVYAFGNVSFRFSTYVIFLVLYEHYTPFTSTLHIYIYTYCTRRVAGRMIHRVVGGSKGVFKGERNEKIPPSILNFQERRYNEFVDCIRLWYTYIYPYIISLNIGIYIYIFVYYTEYTCVGVLLIFV